MKKLLITVAALMVTLASTMAQGQVNFATKVGTTVDAKVKDPLGVNGALTPPYSAALQVKNGTTYSTIASSISAFRTGLAAGYVVPSTVEVPGVPIGGSATLRLVAFNGSAFEGATESGFSNDVTVTLGGGTVLPPDLVGLQGFTIVPEPSTIALGVLGAAALMLRRRK
jgi:hypothetical protein